MTDALDLQLVAFFEGREPPGRGPQDGDRLLVLNHEAVLCKRLHDVGDPCAFFGF